jgi:hypothetical protein
MKAGELKEILKDIPDDTPIVVYRSNMEGSGYTDEYTRVHLEKMVRVKETRVDAFDHEAYTVEVLQRPFGWDLPQIDVLLIE